MQELVQQTHQVQARRHAADGSGQNVVEHERRNRELGQGSAHGLLHHAIHTAAHEHAAALDVDRTDRVGEQHDGEDEPGSGFANEVLGNGARIEGGGAHVVEHDRGRPPERDKRQHGGGGHQHPLSAGLG